MQDRYLKKRGKWNQRENILQYKQISTSLFCVKNPSVLSVNATADGACVQLSHADAMSRMKQTCVCRREELRKRRRQQQRVCSKLGGIRARVITTLQRQAVYSSSAGSQPPRCSFAQLARSSLHNSSAGAGCGGGSWSRREQERDGVARESNVQRQRHALETPYCR